MDSLDTEVRLMWCVSNPCHNHPNSSPILNIVVNLTENIKIKQNC